MTTQPPMRALFFDTSAPHRLGIGEAPQPVPRPHEVIVDNVAVSLNFGEVAFRNHGPGPRTVLGWDSSGVVSRAAADGTGPSVGTRVVTFGWHGGWAERRAVATSDLAGVPAAVDLARPAPSQWPA